MAKVLTRTPLESNRKNTNDLECHLRSRQSNTYTLELSCSQPVVHGTQVLRESPGSGPREGPAAHTI